MVFSLTLSSPGFNKIWVLDYLYLLFKFQEYALRRRWLCLNVVYVLHYTKFFLLSDLCVSFSNKREHMKIFLAYAHYFELYMYHFRVGDIQHIYWLNSFDEEICKFRVRRTNLSINFMVTVTPFPCYRISMFI